MKEKNQNGTQKNNLFLSKWNAIAMSSSYEKSYQIVFILVKQRKNSSEMRLKFCLPTM